MVKDCNQDYLVRLNVIFSQMVIYREYITIDNTGNRILIGLPLVYLQLTLAHSNGQCEYRRQFQMGQTVLLSSNRKSYMGFRLAYLQLTLTYYKGQG